MLKTVLISIIVVVLLFFTSQYLNFSGRLLSPDAVKKTKSVEVQDELFLKYKNKVEIDSSVIKNWGVGKGATDLKVGQSANYVVVNGEGQVVVANNADTKHSPASLTKLMTVMVTLDMTEPSDVYTVPQEAINLKPTILLLDVGEKLTVEELITGALITSANDAAYTLAFETGKNIGGNYKLFVKLMNQKAKNLGLANTQFANATGYDNPEQFSTARDLATMTHYALEHYPMIKKIVAMHEASIPHTNNHKVYELPNWNALLGVYPGVDGVKIGHTDESGHSTIVTSTRQGKKMMAVLLGAPDMRARDRWTAEILNSAFETVGVSPFKVTLGMLQKRSLDWSNQLKIAREKSIAAGENVPTRIEVEGTREE